MIGRALRGAVVLLVGFVLVSACGSDRPEALSMDEVKPCELISQSDLKRFQVRAQPQSRGSVSGVGTEGSSCYYNPLNTNSVRISAITNHGIDRWMNGSLEHSKFKELSRIQGFRAIKVWQVPGGSGPDSNCKVYVDVAGGQSLRVQVDRSFEKKDPPTCDTARRYAEAAMKTLAN
ncbi:DUF3558 family protein [Actinopolyspora halophila]|uniref:DUF3558 family protein n=1 Tax=Actinopolyspora halophila TaxID=1850 RepID=UPI000A018A02|nr:DUF3558 family protein [Actinopolyspora halophila]